MIEAYLNKRKFIGIELDKEYWQLSKKRFLEIVEKERGIFDEK